MTTFLRKSALICGAVTTLCLATAASAQTPAPAQQPNTARSTDPAKPLSFFVTSEGLGKGADLGGLAGADAHCQKLAESAGAGKQTWRAYLSTTEPGGAEGVNARDRIGHGPWHNAKGAVVAKSVDDLHSGGNNVNKQTALTEKGEVVPGRGDQVNQHDILTGSDPNG
ncbi:MAG: lectin, partial [Pseudomonadota bacterium]